LGLMIDLEQEASVSTPSAFAFVAGSSIPSACSYCQRYFVLCA
jgi:hypothetical protein